MARHLDSIGNSPTAPLSAALIDLRQIAVALCRRADQMGDVNASGRPRRADRRLQLRFASAAAANSLREACDAAATWIYERDTVVATPRFSSAEVQTWRDLILFASDNDPEGATQDSQSASPRAADYRATLRLPPGAPISSSALGRALRGRRLETHPDAQSRRRQAALGRVPMSAAAAARRFRQVSEAAATAADPGLRAAADAERVATTRRRVEEATAAAAAIGQANAQCRSHPAADWVSFTDGVVYIGGQAMRTGFAPSTANTCGLDSILQLTGLLIHADATLLRRRAGGFAHVTKLASDASALLSNGGGSDVAGAFHRSYIDNLGGNQSDAYADFNALGRADRARLIADTASEIQVQLCGWDPDSAPRRERVAAPEFLGMTTPVGMMAIALCIDRTIVEVHAPRPDSSGRVPASARPIVSVYGQWLGNDVHVLYSARDKHYVPLFGPGAGARVPRWNNIIPASGIAAAASAAAELESATAAAASAEVQLRRNAGLAARSAAAAAHRAAAAPSSDRQQRASQRQHGANVRRDQGICCDVCSSRQSLKSSAKGEILKCSGPGADQDGYCIGARHANCRHQDQAAHPAYVGQGPFFCSVVCRIARAANPRDDDDDDSGDAPSPSGSASGHAGGPLGAPRARPVRPPRVAHNDRQHIDEALLVALRAVNPPDIFRCGLPPLLTDVPGGSRRQLSSLWAESCVQTEDEPDDDGPHKLRDLFAILLLVKPTRKESKGKSVYQIVNKRFKRLTQDHDVTGLLQYAKERRGDVIDQRQTNLSELENCPLDERCAKKDAQLIKRADHCVSEGFVSQGLRVLAQEAPPPAGVALRKLEQLCRPAGAPISDDISAFVPPRRAFDGAESPRDEPELLDELLSALASSKNAAGGPNGITGRHLRGMLLDSEDALIGTLHVLDKIANDEVPECVQESLRMSLLVALRKPAADPGPSPNDDAPNALAGPAVAADVGIRPIAMGQMLRRLTGKMLLRLHIAKYRQSAGVAQLGLEKCAAEVGYHAAVLKLQSMAGPKCILMWDIEHAFGSAERTLGLEAMINCVPEAVPFARSVYGGDAAELLYAEPVSGTVHSLHSRQGFDQGCPQAGPLFCFTYKAALDDVSAAFPDTLISAYYDDSPMVGQPLRVAEAYNYLLREDGPLRAANMRNHPSKTRVWSPVPLSDEERAAFPAGTKFEEPEDGIIMWGCPIGSDAFIRRTLDAAVAERFRAADDDGPLGSLFAQNSMCCMRVGINARFDNLLRVVPPRILMDAAASWDDKVLNYVERFVGDNIPEDARLKVALPLRDGGLGLRSKSQLMHVAFLSAWLGCRSLIWERFPSLRAALDDASARAAAPLVLNLPGGADVFISSSSPGQLSSDLREAYTHVMLNDANNRVLTELLGVRGLGDFTAPDAHPEEFERLQKRLSSNVHAAIKAGLLDRTDQRGRALILSAGGPGACAWLTAQRGWGPDFILPNQHMRLAVSFRLGLDLPQLKDAGLVGTLCPLLQCSELLPDGRRVYLDPADRHEACTGICDAKGDHLLGCKFGHNGRIRRHNDISNVITRIVRASFQHKVQASTNQKQLQQFMRRFDVPGAPPSNHHIPDWRIMWLTLGHDDDIGDAVITGFNTARNSGSVTGASALQIQQDKYKQYTSAVRSRPPPVTRSQLTAFAMDTAGLIAPDGVAMIKKIGERKAAVTSMGMAESSLSRKSQNQRAVIYQQHMAQAIGVTLMRAQMHVILQAAYNGHQRNATPCARVPMWSRPMSFDASWATAYNATCYC